MFKDNIKDYRLKHNLSMVALAEKIEVSKWTVAAWEDGKKLPNKDAVDKLCLLFDVSEKDLLDEEEYKKILRRGKSKGIISKIIIYTFVILVSLILLDMLISFVRKVRDDLIPDYENARIENYKGEFIALEKGKEYTINFDDILSEANIKYDKIYLDKSEHYDYKKSTIKPIKEGIFYVEFTIKNRKERIKYTGTALKVYCYDLNNFIEINTVEDLCNMNNNKAGHYILNSDLDLKDIENFNPIGNFPAGNEFTGIFINPNNYVIHNLTIKSASEIYHGPYGGCAGGLFGNVRSAYIDNVILDNVYIDISDFDGESWSSAGGIADLIQSSLVTNCKVSGTIIGQLYVGGIAGAIGATTLNNNTFTGKVIQKNGDLEHNPSAGGLVGWLYGCSETNSFQSFCEVSNNIVHAEVISESIAGKVAGFIYGDCIHDNVIVCELDAPEEYEIGKSIRG